MATNKNVEEKEREENKKGLILFIILLILLLALFIGIRALSSKKEDKKEQKEPTTEQVVEDKTMDETVEEENPYVYTEQKTTKVKKTSNNQEQKNTLTLVLKGDNVIYVDYSDEYIDEGAYALDTKDGDLSVSIVKTIYLNNRVVDFIDTTNSGAVYTIKYVITNSRGETKEVVRTVIIKQAEVTIALNGNSEEKLEYQVSNRVTYTDLGATATTSNGINIPVTSTITRNGEMYEGNISSDQLGTYIITYTATYNDKNYVVTRTVRVEDTVAPVITTEKETYKYLVEEEAELTLDEIKALFNVTDEDTNIITTLTDADGVEMTTNISKALEGEYTIILSAKDRSNNVSERAISISVMKDTEAPTVTITNIATSETEYTIEFSVSDNYSENENIAISYALLDGTGGDIDFIDLENGQYSFTIPVTDIGTAKFIAIKVKDECGNENAIVQALPSII